ncbi:MAG TPA: DegV family protein [Chloroflexi bacterium]|nr:DegV family protein [Chloroflexota bacterium]
MEQLIQIVTDSSCDLPKRFLERLKIIVVPLIVRFGPEEYSELELSLDEFWAKATGPHHPHTSQPSVGTFEEVFSQLVERGKRVLCLTVTGKHSGTYNAANLAAQRFGETVEVLDSLSVSLGLGFQAMAAAKAAEAGQSMQEIVSILDDMRSRIQLTILLDTLENLRYGGRAASFMAVMDRMTRILNIKPIVNFVDGQLRLVRVVRTFRRGVNRLLDTVESAEVFEHLAVVHTRRKELAAEIADRLAERSGFPRERIWVTEATAVLACHAGEGVIGIVAIKARGQA